MRQRDPCVVSRSTMPTGGNVTVSLRAKTPLAAGHGTNQQTPARSRDGTRGEGIQDPIP
jgi:hypothetical protein